MKTLGFVLVSLFIGLMATVDIVLGTYYLQDYRDIRRKCVMEMFGEYRTPRDLINDLMEFE